MKLRIRGNSIRLRLSQQDVKVFGEKGRVENSIQFGATAGGQLTYVLESAEVKKLKSEFSGNTITIFVPTELGEMWVNSQLVGMEHLDATTENDQIRILVEKDFKCMHVRINEDESDSFPHPKS
ncbi:MAG: hypothetical protein AB8H03_10255 [Saprospiraceae bacterium]